MFLNNGEHCFATVYKQFRNIVAELSVSIVPRPDLTPCVIVSQVIMSSEVIAGLCAANLYFLLRGQRNEAKKRRCWWMRKALMEGTNYRDKLLSELKLEDGSRI
ncbi:hypothetical protein J437_LFUL014918 [Ladona fulva]|uniref:Uncharacterized protein n=1 Tax=Ladona fulva TaxID=123851 RepID=A0A8K0KKQ7_LADFU|nr:hypothetical protein J437_LFUL014918 [Ladona fulva]